MAAYLARLKDSHEIVGILNVEHDHELFFLIDECTNPEAVEIMKLETGGVFWLEGGAPTLPLSSAEEEGYTFPVEASVSDGWMDAFLVETEPGIWRSVPPMPGRID